MGSCFLEPKWLKDLNHLWKHLYRNMQILMISLITLTQTLMTQNEWKNVWIYPALCNHKGMSWDISAFPLQDPSFPTARPGLENLFPLLLPSSLFRASWRHKNATKAGLVEKHKEQQVLWETSDGKQGKLFLSHSRDTNELFPASGESHIFSQTHDRIAVF